MAPPGAVSAEVADRCWPRHRGCEICEGADRRANQSSGRTRQGLKIREDTWSLIITYHYYTICNLYMFLQEVRNIFAMHQRIRCQLFPSFDPNTVYLKNLNTFYELQAEQSLVQASYGDWSYWVLLYRTVLCCAVLLFTPGSVGSKLNELKRKAAESEQHFQKLQQERRSKWCESNGDILATGPT